MIKRVTTTAILVMVVAAVALALLVTPAESSPYTTAPYSAGERWNPQGVDVPRNCNKVAGAQNGVPEGYWQTVYVACKLGGGFYDVKVYYVTLDGQVVSAP
jgi:hypothetical protein